MLPNFFLGLHSLLKNSISNDFEGAQLYRLRKNSSPGVVLLELVDLFW
jgi:hypothetical protein